MVQRYKLYLRYPNIYDKYYRSLTVNCILYTKNSEASYRNLPHCFSYQNQYRSLPWFEVTVEILTRSCEVFSVWVFVFRFIQT